MKIFDRYIFRELFTVFILSIVILTVILFLEKIHFLSELILNKGVPAFDVILLLLYISPSFLSVTIPMSILLGTIMVFSRLSAENELIAIKACGISVYRLMVPVIMVSILAWFSTSYIMINLQHKGNFHLKNMMLKILRSQADVNLKERTFNTGLKNMTIYVDKKNINNPLMEGVFIYEEASKNSFKSPRIITAKKGAFLPVSKSQELVLHLEDGEIQQMGDDHETYRLLTFGEYDLKINFNKGEDGSGQNLKGRREMSIPELRERVINLRKDKQETASLEVEIQTKFALPFSCVVFGLLGAPLGIRVNRSGRGGGFGMGIIMMLINYLFLISGQSLGEKGVLPPMISMWLPNLILMSVAAYLLWRTAREMAPFALTARILNIRDTFLKRLKFRREKD